MTTDIKNMTAAAFAAYRGRRPEDAKRLTKTILAAYPNLVEIRVLDAVLVAEDGGNEDSIRMLKEVLEFAPQSVYALNFLAGNYRKLDRRDEAMEVSKKLIEIAPGRMEGYLNLGLVLVSLGQFEEAAELFEKAAIIAPKEAVIHFNIGVSNAKMFRYPAAETALRKAISLDPRDPRTYMVLADVVDNQRREPEAIKLYQKAAELEPDTKTGIVNFAISLVMDAKTDEAAEFVARALEKRPDDAGIRTMYSSILQQLGRFDEANHHARLAIESEPDQSRPYAVMIASAKVTEEDRPHIEKLATFVDDPDQGMQDLAKVHYALGKAYNDLQEYGEAMHHYEAANGLMSRRHWFYNLSEEASDNTILQKKFTKALFKEKRSVGAETDKPIFIVGMIRSGTTLTEQILSSHSLVGGAGETQFWLNKGKSLEDSALTDPRVLRDLQKEFLELLEKMAPGFPRVTEKMPLNYLSLGLIHLAFPNARIIHVRRKPIDTCLSIYVTQFKGGLPFGHDRSRIIKFYREYLRMMEHWRKVIPADRLFEVDYENLVADREPVVRQMLEFCGLDWEEACLHPEDNERAVRTPSLWQVRQPVYRTSVERWRRYEPWLGEFRELLSPEDLASLTVEAK